MLILLRDSSKINSAGRVAERFTRTTQNRMGLRPCGFESHRAHQLNNARVAELADATDLRSVGSNTMWVRPPPRAPK